MVLYKKSFINIIMRLLSIIDSRKKEAAYWGVIKTSVS